MSDKELRDHLLRLLDWQDAHVSFEAAVNGISPELRGVQPDGLPYSAWQLLEHLRIGQWDILDFCRNPSYEEMKWPDDYWPPSAEPPNPEAWDESIIRFKTDLESLKQLTTNTKNLFAKIPHGSGQTYLRELLLVADHNAYHVGQLVTVRRLLGIWQ